MSNASTDTDTASHLKAIVSPWPTILNNRDVDFTSPEGTAIRNSIATGFRATLDGYPSVLSWNGLLGVWKQEFQDYPDCWIGLADSHAYVDEAKGTATVYLDMDMHFVPGVRHKAYTELKWTLGRDGKWVIREFVGMRGNKGNAGFV